MIGKIGLMDKARPFLHYLEEWYDTLPSMSLEEIIGDAPDKVALFSIDMINGFCREGPLASPRVDALTQPVVDIFRRAYDLGVRALVFTQDSHDPNTPEFEAYPPHCIAGTPESETIVELQELPFQDNITTIPKNSISSHIATTLDEWMQAHPQMTTFIVVGDCTDLCVYSAAMHLRLQANALNIQRRVIVPAKAVDTYDIPVSVAQEAGICAHEGDLHHVMFLHHMALNGIEVIAEI